MDKIPLNFALLSNWHNWARVILMVIIGGIAFDLIASNIGWKTKEGN